MSVQMETAPRLASESGGISKALTDRKSVV